MDLYRQSTLPPDFVAKLESGFQPKKQAKTGLAYQARLESNEDLEFYESTGLIDVDGMRRDTELREHNRELFQKQVCI